MKMETYNRIQKLKAPDKIDPAIEERKKFLLRRGINCMLKPSVKKAFNKWKYKNSDAFKFIYSRTLAENHEKYISPVQD